MGEGRKGWRKGSRNEKEGESDTACDPGGAFAPKIAPVPQAKKFTESSMS